MRPLSTLPVVTVNGDTEHNLASKGLDPQLTGNAGLYFSCYHLSLLGWNVMPTARNARGVDILAYSQDATRKLAIQVKTLSKRNPVPLGPSPTAFIMFPDEVKNLAKNIVKDGKTSYWLQPPQYDHECSREQWGRIGRG
jgi:hypothetical protein